MQNVFLFLLRVVLWVNERFENYLKFVDESEYINQVVQQQKQKKTIFVWNSWT